MPSSFLGIYKAVFAYQPQSDQELSLQEGDILYVTEKSNDDDWWTAKKKTGDDEEEEPVGLVPNNYIEEVSLHLSATRLLLLYGTSYKVEKEEGLTADLFFFLLVV